MKAWYKSKTLWVNAVAFIATAVQVFTGFVVNEGVQAAIIIVINIFLRAITTEEITW